MRPRPFRTLATAAAAWFCGAAVGSSAAAQPAPTPTPASAPTSAPFVCPEDQPDVGARAADLSRVFRDAPPGASIFDILSGRRLMLEQHGCARTLANMAAHEAAVAGGDVRDQAWFPIRGPALARLAISSTYLKAFLDPRSPGERAVDTYAQALFPAPQTTSATRVSYDELVSHVVYYCATSRYALVENAYFLRGAPVLKDPSPHATVAGVTVWPVTPTPPGSLNADVAAAACGGLRALPS